MNGDTGAGFRPANPPATWLAAANVPDLALDIEVSLRSSGRRTSAKARTSGTGETYGNRSDATIRSQLDELGLRSNQSTLVSPNHCFTPTPVCGVGPGEEPRPADPIPPPKGSAGRGVRVAIIDTGIFRDVSQHPWLASGVNFSLSDVEPPDADCDGFIDPVSGHGHFVAGIVRTAAPGATIFVERLFHRGRFILESDLNTALHTVIDADPHIINLSLTGQTWSGGPPTGLVDVWRKLRRKTPEIVVVASAGNAGKNVPFWPAAQPEVVSVGAVDDRGLLPTNPDFSNYGTWVKVFARGYRVVNAYTTGILKYELPAEMGTPSATFKYPFCSWSGTSFSAPLVTGRIAARMTKPRGGLSAAAARDAVIADARAAGTSGPGGTAPDGSPIYIVK